MFAVIIGRLLGALGLLALALFAALLFFAPDAPGLSYLGGTAALGLSGWVYLDWAALGRFFASRGGKDQGLSFVLIALVAGITGFVIHIAERDPVRWDLTEGRQHSLTDQAEAIVAGVDPSLAIEVTGFFVALGDPRQQEQRTGFVSLGESVRAANPAITWTAIDPDAQPQKALEAGVTGNGTVILRATRGGESRTEQLFSPDEGEFANALLRLGQESQPKVAFVSGHGEFEVTAQGDQALGTFAGQLRVVGFEVERLQTARIDAIPDDVALLVVVGPQATFAPGEVAMIQRWVDEDGGALLLALEPNLPGRPALATGWEGVLPGWGMKLRSDLVLDELMHSYVGDATSVISAGFGYHDITDDLRVPTVFPTARSIQNVNEDPSAQTLFELVQTSEAAWGETRLQEGAAARDEDDFAGPLTVAALAELHRDGVEKQGKVLVVGDADWLTDGGIGSFGNADLAQRAVAFLAEQDDLVKIPPKAAATSNMQLDLMQTLIAILAAVLLIPGGVLLLGLIVFVWRRSL